MRKAYLLFFWAIAGGAFWLYVNQDGIVINLEVYGEEGTPPDLFDDMAKIRGHPCTVCCPPGVVK